VALRPRLTTGLPFSFEVFEWPLQFFTLQPGFLLVLPKALNVC
jgi:hypothetical protein